MNKWNFGSHSFRMPMSKLTKTNLPSFSVFLVAKLLYYSIYSYVSVQNAIFSSPIFYEVSLKHFIILPDRLRYLLTHLPIFFLFIFILKRTISSVNESTPHSSMLETLTIVPTAAMSNAWQRFFCLTASPLTPDIDN